MSNKPPDRRVRNRERERSNVPHLSTKIFLNKKLNRCAWMIKVTNTDA